MGESQAFPWEGGASRSELNEMIACGNHTLKCDGAERSEADEVETSSYIPSPFYPSSLNLIRPAGHLPLPGEGLGVSLSGYTFNYCFALSIDNRRNDYGHFLPDRGGSRAAVY